MLKALCIVPFMTGTRGRHQFSCPLGFLQMRNPKVQHVNWTQGVNRILQGGLFPVSMKLLKLATSSKADHGCPGFSLKSSPRTQQLWCRLLVVPCGAQPSPQLVMPTKCHVSSCWQTKGPPESPCVTVRGKSKMREGYDGCAFKIL